MNLDLFYLCGQIALSLPVCAIAVIVLHYFLRRAEWERNRRLGKSLGYYPSMKAMGTAFQYMQVFTWPSIAYVLEARQQQEEDTDEDDDGDPETLGLQLHRQLWRIRRGEPVDRLILRL